MLALAAIVLPVAMAGSAASTIGFELRLRVPVICSVEGMAPSPDNTRALRVVTSCNAENLDLSFSGDLAGNRIVQVTSSSFAASFGDNNVSLRQYRPGAGEIEIVFDEELQSVSRSSVSLVGY
jgi:hypothetical protein